MNDKTVYVELDLTPGEAAALQRIAAGLTVPDFGRLGLVGVEQFDALKAVELLRYALAAASGDNARDVKSGGGHAG